MLLGAIRQAGPGQVTKAGMPAPSLDPETLRRALDSGGVGVWSFDPRTGETTRSGAYDALYGYPEGYPGRWDAEACFAHILPEDRAMVAQAWTRALTDGAPMRLLYRILRAGDGATRWIEATGMPVPREDGAPRYLGTLADVTDREERARRQALLVGEMRHRVKNVLANVQCLAAQTGREAASVQAFLSAFGQRLSALAEAHELSEAPAGGGASLAAIAGAALEPWRGGGQIETRLPDRRLGSRQALALSLALHELATNAAKHGALSVPHGRVTLAAMPEADGLLVLRWRESGGPPARAEALGSGFGTRLLLRALPAEMGGTIVLLTPPEGLCCEMRFTPRDDVAAAEP